VSVGSGIKPRDDPARVFPFSEQIVQLVRLRLNVRRGDFVLLTEVAHGEWTLRRFSNGNGHI
jgi:hypothetical protein